MRSLTRFIIALVLVTLGISAMIVGEADDSPGLGGIGLIVIISTLVWVWRHRRGAGSQ